MRSLRVKLNWSDRETGAEDAAYIDIYADDQGNPHPQITFFGWLTDGADHYPFKVTKEELDFGSACEPSERWGKTNIRAKRIDIGEYATFTIEGLEYTYRIAKVDDLSLV